MNFVEGNLIVGPGAPRLDLGDASIELAAYRFARSPPPGRAVLGVRPEHIGVGEAPNGHHAARGEVRIVEPMGADTIVWTELAGRPVTLRVDGDAAFKVGEPIAFHFDLARASLFAADAGDRL